MSTLLGSLRRLALAPSLADVGYAGRRFPVVRTARTDRLERIPQSVVCGFEWAVDCSGLWELERRLSMVEPELRGFAYEGAAMATTVLDALSGFRGTRTRDLLDGPARPHLLLAYIGIGFAMARLPRPTWAKVLPDLDGAPHHRTMSWLAVDGFAFDRAYFDTRRVLDAQHVGRPYAWQGRADYFGRAADQGIGRALWFVHGADPGQVTVAVERFPAARRADLWSGVGLAASFAGGADARELTTLRRSAGPHGPELGLGAVFAATARQESGYVPEHTGTATAAFAGLSVARAVALAEATADPGADAAADASGAVPGYERWRGAIRAALGTTPFSAVA